MQPFKDAMATEVYDRQALGEFLRFVMQHDVQILANRREARGLYQRAVLEGITTSDPVFYTVEKAEKIATFLELQETHVQGSTDNVNTYAFVRLVGELRRNAMPARSSAGYSTDSGSGRTSRPPSDTGAARVQPTGPGYAPIPPADYHQGGGGSAGHELGG